MLADLVAEQESLAVQEARLLGDFEQREGYTRDACVNMQGWLWLKTPLSRVAAQRRVKRARLLQRMPLLCAALADARTSTHHVDAISSRAIPARFDRICEHEGTLTGLACEGEPRDVATVVARIVEHGDPDGTDDPPPCSAEDLRELRVTEGFAGLGDVRGATTPLLTELLLRVRDLYGTPDPADTPPAERRTPAQRFHDAVRDALIVALDNHPGCAIDGVKAHIVLFADLFTLLGHDELATIAPRLSASGGIDAETARHLIATTNPTLRAVLGLGPWLPVAVGRARRVLPQWLRGAAQVAHQHCQGPGCDRPFAWCEADHLDEFWRGGITALRNNAPLCTPHNNLKHVDGWIVTFDVTTGIVTWTSADGTRRIELPPPDI